MEEEEKKGIPERDPTEVSHTLLTNLKTQEPEWMISVMTMWSLKTQLIFKTTAPVLLTLYS